MTINPLLRATTDREDVQANVLKDLQTRLAQLERAAGRFRGGAGAPSGTGSKGQWYYDLTNLRSYQSDGSGWIIMSEPTQNYAPNPAASAGTITSFSFTQGFFQRENGWCNWIVNIGCSNNGTGSGALVFDTPKTQVGLTNYLGSGRENAVVGHQIQVIGNAANLAIAFTYANGYPCGTGYSMFMAGRYVMATRYL